MAFERKPQTMARFSIRYIEEKLVGLQPKAAIFKLEVVGGKA